MMLLCVVWLLFPPVLFPPKEQDPVFNAPGQRPAQNTKNQPRRPTRPAQCNRLHPSRPLPGPHLSLLPLFAPALTLIFRWPQAANPSLVIWRGVAWRRFHDPLFDRLSRTRIQLLSRRDIDIVGGGTNTNDEDRNDHRAGATAGSDVARTTDASGIACVGEARDHRS